MTPYQYIDQYKIALLKSTPSQLEQERVDLRNNFKGDNREFDAAWRLFIAVNEGKFLNDNRV